MEPEPLLRPRAGSSPPELRGDRRIVFYPAVFDVPTGPVTEHGETFTEIVRPGAFARSLAGGRDVYATLEHDPKTTFARQSTGLLLQEDERGLFATAYLSRSPANDAIIDRVRSGELTGASFLFRDAPGGRKRTRTGAGSDLHEVTDVDLVDVCLSAGKQIYRQTAVSLRAAPPADILTLRLRRQRLACR